MGTEVKDRLIELQGHRTAEQFGKDLGVSRQTINYWLKGDRTPSAENIKTICTKEGVSADWLIGLSDIRTTNKEIKGIAEYTGLSENSIEALHRMKHETHGTLNKALSFVNRALPHENKEYSCTFFSLCEDYITGTGEAGYMTIGNVTIEKDRLFVAATLQGIYDCLDSLQHECGHVLKTSIETLKSEVL